MTTEEHQKLSEETHRLCVSIVTALKGDGLGSIGIVDQIKFTAEQGNKTNEKLNQHIKKYDAKENKRTGIMGAIVFVWGAIVVLLNKFL